MTNDKEIKTNDREVNDLKRKANNVINKFRLLNAKKIERDNTLSIDRTALVNKLLKEMEKSGVDLNDLSSIRNFLTKLEENNPDLLEMFQYGFGGLTNEGVNNVKQTLIDNLAQKNTFGR
jgi:hypothetical protein